LANWLDWPLLLLMLALSCSKVVIALLLEIVG
jgi:hypothetical protein